MDRNLVLRVLREYYLSSFSADELPEFVPEFYEVGHFNVPTSNQSFWIFKQGDNLYEVGAYNSQQQFVTVSCYTKTDTFTSRFFQR